MGTGLTGSMSRSREGLTGSMSRSREGLTGSMSRRGTGLTGSMSRSGDRVNGQHVQEWGTGLMDRSRHRVDGQHPGVETELSGSVEQAACQGWGQYRLPPFFAAMHRRRK